MRKSRLLKAEIIVLVCVAVLWAVNLKTHCVPRATTGALRQVIKVAPNNRSAHELLGHTYYGLGWSDEGDEAYDQAEVLACKKAVESSPADPKPPERAPRDQIDLLAILSQQYQQVRQMQLAPFDDIEAEVKANAQHALDTSYKQYQIDVEAIRHSGIPQGQQAQRINQLNANYQKKWVEMKSRVPPEVEAQEARRREIIAELETDYAERVTRLQHIQTMLEKDLLDPVAAKREQLRIVGFDLPLSSLNPERMATLAIGGSHSAQRNAGDRTPMVEAIIAANGRFCALVAGEFVYEGGVVSGYRMRKIHEDRVEFEKDGNVWVQKVN